MSSSKIPCNCGLPAELYFTFWDILCPIWLSTLNSAIDKGCLHQDLNTALITVLPKPGKDPRECASHCPMSLIDGYLKILIKRASISVKCVQSSPLASQLPLLPHNIDCL